LVIFLSFGIPRRLVPVPERFFGRKKAQHLAEGPLEHPVRGSLIDWYLDVLGTVPIFRETGVGTSEFKGRYIQFAGEREGTFFIFRSLFEISKGLPGDFLKMSTALF